MKITKTEDGYELEHRGHVIAYNSHAHVSMAFVVKALDQLRAELIESHAREAQLREALNVSAICRPMGCETLTEARERKISEALAMPHDDTALKARLKAERERCAKVCDVLAEEGFTTYAAAREIRNLGDE